MFPTLFKLLFLLIQALNGCTSLDPKAATGSIYHHHQSVSDMNAAFAEVINKNIDEDIQSNPFIAILADESIDIAVYKKLDIYIRLVKDGEPCTRFVGNRNVVDGKAETIYNALMDFMQEKNIDCGNKLVGLGSDGASVMMGRHNGVGVRLKSVAPFMVHTHCVAHRLALCSAQAAKSIKLFDEYQTLLTNIFNFYSNSAVRYNKLREIQNIIELKPVTLKAAAPTRWLSLHNAVDAIYKCWSALVDCLEHQAAEKNDENSTKAKGYLKQVQQYKFVAATCMMKDVLPTLTKLSLYFQRENVGISSVEPMVTSTITTLQTLRNDLGGDLANLPSLKELNQQLLTSDSYCEKELQQTSDNARQAFINSGQAFLAKLIENLQERFPSETLDICKALDIVVNPQSLPHTAADIAAHGIDALNKLVENYGQQKAVGDRNVDPLIDPEVTRADYLQFKFLLNTNRLLNMQEFSKKFLTDEGLCEQFPTFTALANIALTIPVSSAACERGFSCQNRIKTGLRNRLSEQNLDSLMKVAIEGPPLAEFDFQKAKDIFNEQCRRRK